MKTTKHVSASRCWNWLRSASFAMGARSESVRAIETVGPIRFVLIHAQANGEAVARAELASARAQSIASTASIAHSAQSKS